MSSPPRTLIARLAQCRVERVTLTGEPTIHSEFLKIVGALRTARMQVGVCTNATTLEPPDIDALASLGGVHCNVSLDGFRAESHSRFRGDRQSFHHTVATVRQLASAGLLQHSLGIGAAAAKARYGRRAQSRLRGRHPSGLPLRGRRHRGRRGLPHHLSFRASR